MARKPSEKTLAKRKLADLMGSEKWDPNKIAAKIKAQQLEEELFPVDDYGHPDFSNLDLNNPDVQAKLEEWLSVADQKQVDALTYLLKSMLARQLDTPQGFEIFYELIHKRPIPEHGKEWIRQIYESHANNRGTVIKGFRGSTKTTIVTITFCAWRIGWEPHRANLLIQVGDDIAKDNSAAVADIVANNYGFRAVFPNVYPDYDKGWGDKGYEVKRIDMGYSQWRELNSSRKDPSFLGAGYGSHNIIGKHPDGVLIVDDIHDENNTASERELATVHKILTGTIFPMVTSNAWRIFIGTPWVEHDTLGYVSSTGEYDVVSTPVYREVDGEKIYVWPEKFDEIEVGKQRRLTHRNFPRMYLLDLDAAKNQVFKYMPYPNSEVRWSWPMTGGVDYASNLDPYKNKDGKGDYFAMAYVAKLPGGGAVVVGGELEHCTQAQAELLVKRPQTIFKNWLGSGVENVGKGDDFVQVLMRNPGLKVVGMRPGKRNKYERLETFLGPWLENGTVRISDAETPFLNELRRELSEAPNNRHDDAMDAVYYALKMMPDVLVIRDEEEEGALPGVRKKMRPPHPAFAFAARRG